MKKSFSLLVTIFLITIFSYLGIFILETKSLQSNTTKNQYLYIQGNNHKEFLKEYVKSTNLENISNISFDDELFHIEAVITKMSLKKQIDIFVKAKNHNISIYEQIIKQ